MTRREVLLGAAALSLAASGLLTVQASAAATPGEGFLGYTLTAQAAGLQVVEDEPSANSHPEAETEVPQSQVRMVSGPLGYALSSIAWPGALAANAGALLLLAGAPVPAEQAALLNDPVRAETRTGGPAAVSNDSVPGTAMHAAVDPARVAADASVDGGTAGATVGFGTTSTRSTAVLGATTATTTADSAVKDLSLAGGTVTVGSLVSHATASTDGRVATGVGTTTAVGVEVAGVPVTVDDRGITVAGTATPVDAAAVEQAVAALGLQLVLSRPSSVRQGGAISYDAGSLVATWTPQGTPNTVTVVLGGARVTASANPVDGPSPTTPDLPDVPVALPPPAAGSGPVTGLLPGGAAVPVTGAGATAVPVTTDPPARAAGFAPVPAGETAPASAVALCVLAALLLLAGLLRLPGLALVPAAATACPDRSPHDD